MKRPGLLRALVFVLASSIFLPNQGASQSVLRFSLPFGPHAVGYRSVTVYDRSRNIPRDTIDASGTTVNKPRPRPIHLSIWYPARPTSAAAMQYRDYLFLYGPPLQVPTGTASARRAAENALLQWRSLLIRNPDVTLATRRDSLRAAIVREGAVPVHAVRDAPADGQAYPVVIYAAGAESPSFDNDLLMEYLASRGYLAIGVPSWTEGGGEFEITPASLETQARDIEFALQYVRARPGEQTKPVAVMGWSWGGLANVVVAARNQSISALISLDGSVHYYWHDSSLRGKVDTGRPFATPSLFLNQGGTPASVIARAGGDTTFTFFNSLRYADAYCVTLKDLRHQNFSSLYNRLAGPQPRYFVADREVANAGYMTLATYIVTFLDAYLRHDAASQRRLTLAPHQLGLPDTNVVVESKAGLRPIPTMAGFRAALGKDGWTSALNVLSRLQSTDPGYTLNRDSLENAGSEFLDDDRVADGLGAYRVYAKLHPRDERSWNGLAEAYAAAHDTTNAIASYQEALRIEPANAGAIAGLRQMGRVPPHTQPDIR